MGIQNPKFQASVLRPLVPEPGEDRRIPCALDVRPTDEEAQAAGFKDAFEWYSYTTSGQLKDPNVVRFNFDRLPAPQSAAAGEDSEDEDLPSVQDSAVVRLADDLEEGVCDLTYFLREEMQMSHPYLFSDVEMLNILTDEEPLVQYVRGHRALEPPAPRKASEKLFDELYNFAAEDGDSQPDAGGFHVGGTDSASSVSCATHVGASERGSEGRVLRTRIC